MNELLPRLYDHIEPVAWRIAERAAALAPATEQAAYLVEVAQQIVDTAEYRTESFGSPPEEVRSTLAWFDLLDGHLEAFVDGTLRADTIISRAGETLWVDFQAKEPLSVAYAHAVARSLENRVGGQAVLELGAGTGGTTRRMSPFLKHCRRFLMTDLHLGFLDRIVPDLQGVPVEIAPVDINALDESMGRFDTIYATNCIHVARDIPATLAALRRLLLPGGALVLGEGAHFNDYLPSPVSLVLALFDGWWDAPRSTWRPRPGFLSRQQWLEAMAETSFVHISAETWSDGRRSFGGVYWGFAP